MHLIFLSFIFIFYSSTTQRKRKLEGKDFTVNMSSGNGKEGISSRPVKLKRNLYDMSGQSDNGEDGKVKK